jgi:hypothetical protein
MSKRWSVFLLAGVVILAGWQGGAGGASTQPKTR